MAVLTIYKDGEWSEVYAYLKENHWHRTDTHELIDPIYIYKRKD